MVKLVSAPTSTAKSNVLLDKAMNSIAKDNEILYAIIGKPPTGGSHSMLEFKPVLMLKILSTVDLHKIVIYDKEYNFYFVDPKPVSKVKANKSTLKEAMQVIANKLNLEKAWFILSNHAHKAKFGKEGNIIASFINYFPAIIYTDKLSKCKCGRVMMNDWLDVYGKCPICLKGGEMREAI